MDSFDFNSMMAEMRDKIIHFCMTGGLKLLGAILLLVIGFKIVNVFGKKIKNMKIYDKLDPTARSFMRSLIVISLKVVLVIVAAIIVGVPMASMVAVIGSAGLAIGLALQGSLSNIAGGFIILVFRPFKVGDFIATVDATGTVEGINLFYTKIVTTDNKVVMVPNAIISNQSLTDYSSKNTRRVDLIFNTSHDADFEKVKSILVEKAKNHKLVLEKPDIEVYLTDYSTNAMAFALRAWCNTDDYWTVFYEITESVKKAFEENEIKVPSQKVDVHINA